MRIRLARLAIIPLLLTTSAFPARAAITAAPLSHDGRWLTDSFGRKVILHGVNMTNKIEATGYDPGAIGFGDDDATFLASEGFNTVRLGLIYKGLERVRGQYDDTYLEHIAQIAHTLGEHGIRVLVDFHQDLFNETFSGEGFPDWAVNDDGLPHQPDGGFPANYFAMPALWRAYDHFWANDAAPDMTRLQDDYAAAWAHAAARLSQEPMVFGYDVFNEPWPGSVWTTCLNTNGCPLFDATLTEFFKKEFQAIRAVDPSRTVMYETHPIFAGGADVHIGDTGDNNAAFSFHAYCLGATVGLPSEVLGSASCPLGEDRPFDLAEAEAQRNGDALMLTEFGATDDLTAIARDVDAADRHMVSWQYWTYYGQDPCCARPAEGIIIDPSQPPTSSNVKQSKLGVVSRPYPRATAGTPEVYNFFPSRPDKLFLFTYSADLSIPQDTEIFLPARQYPNGYTVTVSSNAQVTSPPGASVLTIRNIGPGNVTVAVTS